MAYKGVQKIFRLTSPSGDVFDGKDTHPLCNLSAQQKIFARFIVKKKENALVNPNSAAPSSRKIRYKTSKSVNMESISIEIVRLEKDAKNNSIKGRKRDIDL